MIGRHKTKRPRTKKFSPKSRKIGRDFCKKSCSQNAPKPCSQNGAKCCSQNGPKPCSQNAPKPCSQIGFFCECFNKKMLFPKWSETLFPKWCEKLFPQWSKMLFPQWSKMLFPQWSKMLFPQWSKMLFPQCPEILLSKCPKPWCPFQNWQFHSRGRRELGASHMHLFFKLQHSAFQSCLRKFAWLAGRLILACALASGYLVFRFGFSHRMAAPNQKKSYR